MYIRVFILFSSRSSKKSCRLVRVRNKFSNISNNFLPVCFLAWAPACTGRLYEIQQLHKLLYEYRVLVSLKPGAIALPSVVVFDWVQSLNDGFSHDLFRSV